jgi:hypothetical protein
MTFRLHWLDLPMLVWCACPVASSLSNGLGAYDGVTGIVMRLTTWGVPYFAGRLYFRDPQTIRDLAVAIFLGGLLYVPLCLFEMRMSPQLHRMVYGYYPHSFGQSVRADGYRPVVFMQHGLMAAFWMTSASICGVWLWASGALRAIRGYRIGVPLGVLVLTTVMMKSAGALALLVCGIGTLYFAKYARRSLPIWVLLLFAPAYVTLRASDMWTGQELVDVADFAFGADRAGSLRYRLTAEDVLMDRAREQALFGWGGWGRARVANDRGKDIAATDGMWIIAYGQNGVIGIVGIIGACVLPALAVAWRVPARQWAHPGVAAGVALAMLLPLYAIDSLFNAMINPVLFAAAGAVTNFAVLAARRPPAPRRVRAVAPGAAVAAHDPRFAAPVAAAAHEPSSGARARPWTAAPPSPSLSPSPQPGPSTFHR